jgi:hypothetical protein
MKRSAAIRPLFPTVQSVTWLRPTLTVALRSLAMSRRAIFRSDYGIFYSLTPTEAAGTISQTGYRTD